MDVLTCPSEEGVFETGCNTEDGNTLVLFTDNTERLRKKILDLFEATFKWGGRNVTKVHYGYFTRSTSYYTQPRIWAKEGLPKNLRYSFLENGVFVMNMISGYMNGSINRILEQAIDRYNRECPDEKIVLSKDLATDFHFYYLRDFQRWLNDYKRY